MAYNLSPEELELVEAVKKSLTRAKRDLKALGDIQQKAGRGRATNAVYAARVAVGVAHVECTDRLFDCWPDDGEVIVARGGGGR